MLPLNVTCSYSGNKGHNQMVPICNLMTDPLYVCYSLNTLAGKNCQEHCPGHTNCPKHCLGHTHSQELYKEHTNCKEHCQLTQ